MSDQRNLILAIVLSLVVLIVYQQFVEAPQMEQQAQFEQEMAANGSAYSDPMADSSLTPQPQSGLSPQVMGAGAGAEPVAASSPSPRINIRSQSLTGSIALRGARLDDISLNNYMESLDEDTDNVQLFHPSEGMDGYYAEYGWATRPGASVNLPTTETLWSASSGELTPANPITLSWANGAGLLFTRIISVDEDYAFTVTDAVQNSTTNDIALAPYGVISRKGRPDTSGFVILHEGPIGVLGGELQEIDYDDLRDDGRFETQTTGGWLGFTDKYWMAIMVPDQNLPASTRFFYNGSEAVERYQVDYLHAEMIAPAGGSVEITSHLFAGAKEVNLIDAYGEQFGAALFDRTIDWGWLYFLTKPMFMALDFFYGLVGNFGIAILLLTITVKLIFYPLANKQYVSMTKMKKLSPKMKEIREKYKDDRMRQQQETMELYKKEKVNPMAGCLPILLQIPVFFALYKTLFVTIEMRHQPFFGWISDLSAPDPLTPLNLFGLIPWDPPSMIAVGIWPILMGLTMYLQQKMNPQQSDPIQAKIFLMMPILFTFILAPFPVGLVIYWTWNNLLSILQQWVIMRRMGVSIKD
ncbi:MAG: membrane protein insertase YidC [Sphingomonadales bacterium]|nr:membrane protein insertase YidC [Sphingomonadales bacterium]